MSKNPKTRNNGQWTEARYRSFVKSALRNASQRWPPKYETLSNAYIGSKVNVKTGRVAKHYECNECKQHFPAKDVEVNHIDPVHSIRLRPSCLARYSATSANRISSAGSALSVGKRTTPIDTVVVGRMRPSKLTRICSMLARA